MRIFNSSFHLKVIKYVFDINFKCLTVILNKKNEYFYKFILIFKG